MSGEERLTEQTDKDKIIAANVRLLEIDLVKETSHWELDDETNDAMEGIVHGTVYPPREGTTEAESVSLEIRYKTRTGKITRLPSFGSSFPPGEYSIFSATITRRNTQQESETHGGINVAERGTIVIPLIEPTGDPGDFKRLSPARVIYRDASGLMGRVNVEWGNSRLGVSAEGDFVLLKSVQLFNQKFGPG